MAKRDGGAPTQMAINKGNVQGRRESKSGLRAKVGGLFCSEEFVSVRAWFWVSLESES